jgi:membrane associated rhomboid family serine protease
MEHNEKLADLGPRFRMQVIVLGGFILTIWLLELVDSITGISLDQFGIVPRQISGLKGIVFAPLLHGGFGHVAANTLPFLVLGWFVILRGMRTFFIVVATAVLIGGTGTWLIAPSASIHIGASGLIFGFFGYLIFRGYFERSGQAILWAILVLVLYGGMLWGILPSSIGVSWQMHLFGFVGGAVAAYILSRHMDDDRDQDELPIEIKI